MQGTRDTSQISPWQSVSQTAGKEFFVPQFLAKAQCHSGVIRAKLPMVKISTQWSHCNAENQKIQGPNREKS